MPKSHAPSKRSKTPPESLKTFFRYGHTPHKANPPRIANMEAEWAVLNAIKRNMSTHARPHTRAHARACARSPTHTRAHTHTHARSHTHAHARTCAPSRTLAHATPDHYNDAWARICGNQNPKFRILRKFFTIQIFLQIFGTRN
jgi:hypothetical protein